CSVRAGLRFAEQWRNRHPCRQQRRRREEARVRSEVSVGRREASRRARWFPWSTRHDHRHPVVAAEVDSRTVGERVADSVASFGGSWPFIFIFLGLIVAWMVLN